MTDNQYENLLNSRRKLKEMVGNKGSIIVTPLFSEMMASYENKLASYETILRESKGYTHVFQTEVVYERFSDRTGGDARDFLSELREWLKEHAPEAHFESGLFATSDDAIAMAFKLRWL